jgi:hypothetical protein
MLVLVQKLRDAYYNHSNQQRDRCHYPKPCIIRWLVVGVKPTYGQKNASTDFTCSSFDHWTAFGLNAPTGTWLKGRFLRCKAPQEPSFCRCPAASPAAVPILSLTGTDALPLNLDKAFQPMLHFFTRMSAQPLHDRQIAIALSAAYQAICPETEYSNFKEWLFTLSYDHWKEIIHVEDESISRLEEFFNEVQKKKRRLEKNSTVLDCSLDIVNKSPRNDEGIDKNNLIVVSFDEQLYLTTYDYQDYWKLSGENTDKLRLFDRKMHDFIVDDIDQKREIVSISVY